MVKARLPNNKQPTNRNRQQAQPEPEPTKSFNNALKLGWHDYDIHADEGSHRPLKGGATNIAKLALVKAWLEQDSYLVDILRKRLQGHDFVDKSDLEQYRLLLSTAGYQLQFNQISNRYKQLRKYATVLREGLFEWQVDRISLGDIQKEGLKALVTKDWEFLLSLNKAFIGSPPEDAKYVNVFKDTILHVSPIFRSIQNITAPPGTAVPTSGPLPGPVAPLYYGLPKVSGPQQAKTTGSTFAPGSSGPAAHRPIGLTGTSRWG
jgi:hypothetical protein